MRRVLASLAWEDQDRIMLVLDASGSKIEGGKLNRGGETQWLWGRGP
jgi:hypothetical protein